MGAFFERLARSPRRALLVDYDGTLAPMTADRRHAEPYPGIREHLMTLAEGSPDTVVWVVSGRAIGDLAPLVRLEGLAELWGSHGLERRTRSGFWIGPAPERADAVRLDEAFGELVGLGAGAIVERKPYGLALHWRGADPGVYARGHTALLGRFGEGAAPANLELQDFEGGLEVRPRRAHKGMVVERVFAELGPDVAVAYLGDDRTDEDAFAAIAGRGLGILVRGAPRPTLADAWLRPPDEVAAFLERWTACAPEKA